MKSVCSTGEIKSSLSPFQHLNTLKKNLNSLVYKIKKSQKFKDHNQSRHEAEKDYLLAVLSASCHT